MDNNNTQSNKDGKNGLFSLLYRTRILILKGESTIINLSILFCVIALLCAPWLVIIGAIVALALGYRFSFQRNASGFAKDFEHVVKDAAQNVRNVVDNVKNTTSHHDDDDANDDNDSDNE